MNRIHGSHGEVSVDRTDPPTGTPTYVVIASLNKWSCSFARDRADVTCFGDTTKQYVQSLPDVKGSVGGFVDTDEQTLFDIAFGETKVMLKLVPSSLVSTFFFSGLAFLDASIDVPATGAATVTGTFVGAGDWAKTPAPVAPLVAAVA